MRLIVTGTGRCGTGYTNVVLNSLGIESTHEEVFTPLGVRPGRAKESEVSWLAAGEALDVLYPDTFKLLLFREPRPVISSFMYRGFFDVPSPWRVFMDLHNPGVARLRGLDAAIYHYEWWNKMALTKVDAMWPLEAPGLFEFICETIDHPYDQSKVDIIPTTVNANDDRQWPSSTLVDPDDRRLLAADEFHSELMDMWREQEQDRK